MTTTDGAEFGAAPEPKPELAQERPEPQAPREPFPWKRLLYSVLFAVIGWFALWIAFALAVFQFIVVAIEGRPRDDLKQLTQNIVEYLRQLFGYITFAQDERPFPFAPFPSANG